MAFRLRNLFGTVRHHRDVMLFLFTDGSPFVAAVYFSLKAIKNPAYVAVSRVREIVFVLQNLPIPSLSKLPPGRCPIGAEDSPWLNAQSGLYRL
jgi:hypothetical protein